MTSPSSSSSTLTSMTSQVNIRAAGGRIWEGAPTPIPIPIPTPTEVGALRYVLNFRQDCHPFLTSIWCLILLFVCLLSGPATDDKHCFDCLLSVSTIKLLGPGRTEKIQESIWQYNLMSITPGTNLHLKKAGQSVRSSVTLCLCLWTLTQRPGGGSKKGVVQQKMEKKWNGSIQRHHFVYFMLTFYA